MASTEEMVLHYDLVPVDEFDALSIELNPSFPSPSPPPPTSKLPRKAKHVSFLLPSGDETSTTEQTGLSEKLGKYPAKAHARKVAKELGVKSGIIYLPGQEEKLYEDSDMGPEFRQRRYFYYLAGADFPGCAVTYDIESDWLVLWIPPTDPRRVLWYGRTPTRQQCSADTEVDNVRCIADLNHTLCRILRSRKSTTIYTLHADQAPQLELTRGTVRIDTTRLKPAIENARVIKTDHEIALIRRANAVSSGAHKEVLTHLKKCRSERDIHTLFLAFCFASGSKKQAYPIIAASGINASTLHYNDNDQPLAGRQLVVLDAGAEWNCYASDVTRTFPISGAFTKEAAAIYRIVELMQNECIERIRPGITFRSLHLHACSVAARELLQLGILHNASVADVLGNGVIAAFFPHGLGHHVGLEVHDVSGKDRLLLAAETSSPSIRPLATGGEKREYMGPAQVAALYQDALHSTQQTGLVQGSEKQKLEKNMIVTVEPGIYFCREYLEAYFLSNPAYSKYINEDELNKYWDVGGVRIEDDILVTDDGFENLTWAPKGEAMLKEINEGSEF